MTDIDPVALAEVATAVWRLRGRVPDDGPLARHVRSVVDALEQAGVTTHRYEAIPFDSGLAVRVLAFQPTDGIDREEVIETIRPGVSLHGNTVQLGEVIVGTPKGNEQEESAA